MSPLLQVKLLRFLQEKVIQRVGGREDIAVDTRIIAATNIDIQESITSGKFREDLYYRIGVIAIELPPLRERGDDIELLANVFLRRFGQEFGQKVRGFSAAALKCLYQYEWPGNVRELENKIKRAVVMSESPIIEADDLGFVGDEKELPEAETGSTSKTTLLDGGFDFAGMSLKEARREVEHVLLQRALESAQGSIVKAAAELKVSRPTFYDLLKKHGLHNNSTYR